ncbi:hypothetical protein Hanom_Chr06g00544901 [Helianthus anomalus]
MHPLKGPLVDNWLGETVFFSRIFDELSRVCHHLSPVLAARAKGPDLDVNFPMGPEK